MIDPSSNQLTIRRIETLDQLDDLITASSGRPVWIFKHSLTCPVSSKAYRQYRRFVDEQLERQGGAGAETGETVYALVEVQNARPVSEAIAERTGVTHQSPQALLVKEAAVAWHASHWKIEVRALRRASGS